MTIHNKFKTMQLITELYSNLKLLMLTMHHEYSLFWKL